MNFKWKKINKLGNSTTTEYEDTILETPFVVLYKAEYEDSYGGSVDFYDNTDIGGFDFSAHTLESFEAEAEYFVKKALKQIEEKRKDAEKMEKAIKERLKNE